MLTRFARVLTSPGVLFQEMLRHLPVSVQTKLDLDLYARPQYAYGIWRAALQAKALGVPTISAIEFGVGSGRGLIVLEKLADELGAHVGVGIATFGFDIGTGLPEPKGYRDLPYLWRGGYYPMNEQRLRTMLRKSTLVIGDVKTVSVPDLPPVGFIAFDLDYYSSTKDAFKVFCAPSLPRVICYFDDVMNAEALQNEFTGELIAIKEFNDSHENMKIAQIRGLRQSRSIPAAWNEGMYALHRFDHPQYNTHISGAESHVRPL
jgi:hypothetical protein